MFCRSSLVFADIFPEPVKIPKIRKIAAADDIQRKGTVRVDLLSDPVRHKHIAVVTGIPVNDLFNLLLLRNLLLFKLPVYFQEKFKQDIQILCFPLKHIGNCSPEFCIKEA